MPIRGYQDLLVWQRGVDLVEAVYRLSQNWPDEERFGLTSQACGAAVSIPANIAEGYGRGSDKELTRFLAIARGAQRELETHLIIACRLEFLARDDARQLRERTDEIGRLLHGLLRRTQQE